MRVSLVVVAVFTLTGLVAPSAMATDCRAAIDIFSDPPGARVYDKEDGQDFGVTSESKPVKITFSRDFRNDEGYVANGITWWACSYRHRFTMVLKKRGYKSTEHTI